MLHTNVIMSTIYTPDRWQSKTLLTFNERESKIPARNNVFDYHMSPMAIENYVSNEF